MFNSAHFIEETLRSLEIDLTENDEVILIDDCSNDESVKLIENYSAKSSLNIKLLKLIENSGGPAHPRNLGIETSNNDFLCFLDSDDIWLKGRRKILSDTLKYGHEVIFTRVIEFKKKLDKADCIPNLDSLNCISGVVIKFYNPLKLSSSCIKKSHLTNLKFNVSRKISGVEDFDLWLRLSRKVDIKLVGTQTIGYRVHTSSISHNKFKHAIKVMKVFRSQTTIWPFWIIVYAIRALQIIFLGW